MSEKIYKLVIAGNSGVGKSSLVHRYLLKRNDDFPGEATIGAAFYAIASTSEIIKKVQIWDIAGSSLYRSVMPIYFRGCHGALFLFDVSNRDSFDDLADWIARFRKDCNNEDAKIMIIANKIDIPMDDWMVTSAEIETLVKLYECEHVYTSSRTGDNMEEFHRKLNVLYDYIDDDDFPSLMDTIFLQNQSVTIANSNCPC